MTQYRVFGFSDESMMKRGVPKFGTVVVASTPEDAVEKVKETKRGAKYINYFGVCALHNFVEMHSSIGGTTHLY